MYFYLLEYKQNCTKICAKEIFLRKGFFICPGSKENVFFSEYSSRNHLLQKKTILEIKVTVFNAQKTFFSF